MPAVAARSDRPRVLVTGFSVFPGAPVNPTEKLIEDLKAEPPDDPAALRAEVLAVEYGGMSERLSAIGHDFAPDIAIHFGLASLCRGFRLERRARNSLLGARADNSGLLPDGEIICPGPETLPSSLPLERMAEALETAGLPVEWSDDAGGYLCNVVFTLSLSHACDGFTPQMSGFIHVPPGDVMAERELVAGARIIIATCLDQWCRTNG